MKDFTMDHPITSGDEVALKQPNFPLVMTALDAVIHKS